MCRYQSLIALVLAVSFWSAHSCHVDRAAGGTEEFSFVEGTSRGSIFYIPAAGCSGALQSVTLTLVDGTVNSFDRGDPTDVDVVARAIDKNGVIVNSTLVPIDRLDSGVYTWTWDPPVEMAPVTHVVHPDFYFRGEEIPPLTDEYVIAFEGLSGAGGDFLHIEADLVSQATEDDVLVVFLDEPQIGPALQDSVAAVDRRDHMGGGPAGSVAVNPAIQLTFVDDVSVSSIRYVKQGEHQFTTFGLSLVNGRGDVVFEVEYDGVTEVNTTDAECRNCKVQSIVAIGAEKRATGSLFRVTVTPTCEGLVTLCFDGLCASVNNISCVLSLLSSV